MYQHGLTRNTLLLTIGLSLLWQSGESSQAASTWTGLGSDINWGTSGNWNASPVFPTALTFAGSTRLVNNNNLSSITVNGITFDAAAGAFVLGGNPITLNGIIGFSANPAAPMTQSVNLNMVLSANETIDTPANTNLVLTEAALKISRRNLAWLSSPLLTVALAPLAVFNRLPPTVLK
jgi:hypothetical protein